MKRVLTILAAFMSMLCGGTILVSCSDGYKKMYLTAEYALPDENGKTDWQNVESGVFDYTLVMVMQKKSEISPLQTAPPLSLSTFLLLFRK